MAAGGSGFHPGGAWGASTAWSMAKSSCRTVLWPWPQSTMPNRWADRTFTRTVPGSSCQTRTVMSLPQEDRLAVVAVICPMAASAVSTVTPAFPRPRHTPSNTALYSRG